MRLPRLEQRAIIPALAILSTLLAAAPALAQSTRYACNFGVYESAPSEETRLVETTAFKVQIPKNYRATGLANGGIEIINPDEYQYSQCAAQHGYGIDGSAAITIEKSPAFVGNEAWPYTSELYVDAVVGHISISDISYWRYPNGNDGAIVAFVGGMMDYMGLWVNNPSGHGSAEIRADDDDVLPRVAMEASTTLEFKQEY